VNLYRKIAKANHNDSLGTLTSRDFYGKTSKARSASKHLLRRLAKKVEAREALKDHRD
jgi:hypothetical protein